MNYWYIFVGCLFLFNPSINLIDFLPDFFGIALILFGMRKIADLNNYIAEAYIKMKYSLWVALGKFVCLLLVGTLDTIMIISFSFVTAVLECMFLIPAFIGLYEGMEYLSIREIDKGVYETSKLKLWTLVFIVIRAVGSFLPGIAAMLISTSNGAVNSGTGMSADSMNLYLNIIFAVIVGGVGVFWLVLNHKLIKSYSCNEELTKTLIARYENEILNNKEIMIRRRIKTMMMFVFVSTIPLITFKIDYHYVMPEFAFGILMLISTYVCGKYTQDKKMRTLSIIAITFGVVEFVVYWIFEDLFGEYTFDSFKVAFENDYYPVLFISIVLLGIAFYLMIYLSHLKMTKLINNAVDESVGLKGEYTDIRRFDIDNEKKKSLKNRVKALNVLAAIYCVISVVTIVTSQLFDLRETWLIKMSLGFILMVLTYFVTKQISDEAENAL